MRRNRRSFFDDDLDALERVLVSPNPRISALREERADRRAARDAFYDQYATASERRVARARGESPGSFSAPQQGSGSGVTQRSVSPAQGLATPGVRQGNDVVSLDDAYTGAFQDPARQARYMSYRARGGQMEPTQWHDSYWEPGLHTPAGTMSQYAPPRTNAQPNQSPSRSDRRPSIATPARRAPDPTRGDVPSSALERALQPTWRSDPSGKIAEGVLGFVGRGIRGLGEAAAGMTSAGYDMAREAFTPLANKITEMQQGQLEGLTPAERAEYERLSPEGKANFLRMRRARGL